MTSNKKLILTESLLLILLLSGKYLPIEFIQLSQYNIIGTIVGFIIYMLVIDLLRRFAFYFFNRNNPKGGYRNTNFAYGTNNIFKFMVGLGLIVFIFSLFGIDLKTLLTSLSIVAAALVLMTKEYLNDFIYGLYFSFSDEFEIKDYVLINDQKGRILELSMFKVKLLNDDDDLVIIPNSKVFNNDIINYTKRDIRSLSIDFQIGLAAFDTVENLEHDLVDALEEYKNYLVPDSFNLKVKEVKKDYLEIKFQYTLKDMDRDVQKKIRKKTIHSVLTYVTKKQRNLIQND